MNSARWTTLIFLAALGYAVYGYVKKMDGVTTPAITRTAPVKESAKKIVVAQPSSAPPIARPPEAKPPAVVAEKITSPSLAQEKLPPADDKSFKLPPNTVPYVLSKDGIAVAFGDIMLGTPQAQSNTGMHGVARTPDVQLWESGVIPYHIQPNVPNPERIQEALALFSQSPITFVPYDNQPDAIVFEAKPGHCRSYMGRVGGLQPIWLSDNCGPTEIAHEIMHALGFIHEQSRTDRDKFIEVLWDNIDDEYKSQFAMIPESLMLSTRGVDFDFQSIMLYKPHAFAKKPDTPTMKSKTEEPLTPAATLSKRDLERLYKIYR